MQRRDFLKKAGIATAGIFVAPYILPSGRLFAASGSRKANHVVFCLYAGGVRNFESVHKREGNLMPNVFAGDESISADIAADIINFGTSPLSKRLQEYGTLFKEFRYKTGPTGHYNGHTTAITGVYSNNNLDIKAHPDSPTVFEYYRKHSMPSASSLNSWWVSNSLGPYPALNYSKYPGYGPLYGANFIAPNYLISQGYEHLGNMKTFNSSEKEKIEKIRGFCDNNFSGTSSNIDPGIINSAENAQLLQGYISDSFNKAVAGQYNNPWGVSDMSGDMYNIFFAEEILKQFKPELLVVNMQEVDVCHEDYTRYCNNLRKADYAVAHLWSTIQSTPGLANDTVLIVAPEHGRNLNGNSIVDKNGRKALDHTGDEISREIFCLVVGPPSVVKQNEVISEVKGESIDIVPAIANILGFENEISSGLLKSFSQSDLQMAFN